MQTDGYQAYEDVGGPKIVHVGCWAHSRRKFVDAVKVNPQDGEAVKMVTRMDALFLVDRDARQKAMSGAERLAHRRELAQPWVEEIREACLTLSKTGAAQECIGQSGCLHAQPMAEAGALSGVRRSGAVQQPGGELDAAGGAGAQELAARGQCQGGPKVAAILSAVESCRRMGVPVKEYLAERIARDGAPHVK